MNKTRSIRLRSTSPVWTAGAGASLFFGWPVALIIIGGILVICALAGIFAVIVHRNEPDETPSVPFSPPPSGPGNLLDDNAGYPEASDAKTAFSPLSPDTFSDIHEAAPPIWEEAPAPPPETMPTEPVAAAQDTAPNKGAPEEPPDVPPAADSSAETVPAPEAEPVSPGDAADEIDPSDSSPSSDGA